MWLWRAAPCFCALSICCVLPSLYIAAMCWASWGLQFCKVYKCPRNLATVTLASGITPLCPDSPAGTCSIPPLASCGCAIAPLPGPALTPGRSKMFQHKPYWQNWKFYCFTSGKQSFWTDCVCHFSREPAGHPFNSRLLGILTSPWDHQSWENRQYHHISPFFFSNSNLQARYGRKQRAELEASKSGDWDKREVTFKFLLLLYGIQSANIQFLTSWPWRTSEATSSVFELF